MSITTSREVQGETDLSTLHSTKQKPIGDIILNIDMLDDIRSDG